MQTASKKSIAIITCLVSMIVFSGCTNWKKKYQALNVEYQNTLGLLERERAEKGQLGEQLTQNQQTIEELQKQIEQRSKSPAEATGFGKGYDVSFDASAGTITVTLSDATAVQPTFVSPNVGPGGEALTFQLTVTDNGGLQSTDTCIVNVTWSNIPPTADAGSDQTVDEDTAATLDGSNSSDPDDGIASYLWTQTAGTSVTLSDATAEQPTFTSPDVGPGGEALTFELKVTDNGGLQSTDTCIVMCL